MTQVAQFLVDTAVLRADLFVRSILIAGIVLYRQCLSQLKSTCCAHGILHGNTCSAVALHVLRNHSLSSALPLIRAQFAACASSHAELSTPPYGSPGLAGTDVPGNVCCETVVEVGIRKTLMVVLSFLFVIKYIMALAYQSNSLGFIGSWVFEWLGPSLIGAAGSELWLIVIASLACDIAVLVAIRNRKVPMGALSCQLCLSFMVLFLENYYMMIIGSWSREAASFLVFETFDQAVPRIAAHLGAIWFPKKAIIAIAWAIATYTIMLGTFIAKDDD